MIRISAVFIISLTFQSVDAQEIDSLNTAQEIQQFLEQKVNTKWKNHDFLETSQKIDTSAYPKGKFYKLDLDNNGFTDLLVNAQYFFTVTDDGNGHFESHFIDGGSFMDDRYFLKNIIDTSKLPLLVVDKHKEFGTDDYDETKTDTLVLMYGAFLEHNSAPNQLEIEEINFSTEMCFGSCPIFDLAIKSDRSATYNAIRYNASTGKFKTQIDTASYTRLLQTINYINTPSLRNDYSVNWTDDQTVTLTIKYKNGTIKEISDYGAQGTFGLKSVYRQLFALRETQNWQ